MAASLPPLVLTGATGFVGRRVVELLREAHPQRRSRDRDVTLLVRDSPRSHARAAPPMGGGSYRPISRTKRSPPRAIQAGKRRRAPGGSHRAELSPAVMREVNVEGTRRLVAASVAAGAAHFVYVSSIAARSKTAAGTPTPRPSATPRRSSPERAPVHDRPADHGLRGGESGAGRARTPRARWRSHRAGKWRGRGSADSRRRPGDASSSHSPRILHDDSETFEAGGAHRLTMRALLARIRQVHALPPRRVRSVPLAVLRGSARARASESSDHGYPSPPASSPRSSTTPPRARVREWSRSSPSGARSATCSMERDADAKAPRATRRIAPATGARHRGGRRHARREQRQSRVTAVAARRQVHGRLRRDDVLAREFAVVRDVPRKPRRGSARRRELRARARVDGRVTAIHSIAGSSRGAALRRLPARWPMRTRASRAPTARSAASWSSPSPCSSRRPACTARTTPPAPRERSSPGAASSVRGSSGSRVRRSPRSCWHRCSWRRASSAARGTAAAPHD